MGVRRWFLHTPPRVGLALTGLVGLLMRDMALTRDEVDGLMAGLLTSEAVPTGTTRLSDWLAESGEGLGIRYVSELRRNYRSSGRYGEVCQDREVQASATVGAAHAVLSQWWGWRALGEPHSALTTFRRRFCLPSP